MSAKQDSSPAEGPPPRRSASWMPVILTAMLVVAIAIVGYFGLQYLKSSSFQEGRAFRVLGEVANQFDNMQGSMASLLRLVPESVFNQQCIADPTQKTQYLGKLDLPDLKLEPVKPGEAHVRIGASQIERYEFDLQLDDPRRPFTIRPVWSDTSAKPGETLECALQIKGNIHQHLPAFASQRYFDDVLLTLPSGVVLASIPNRAVDRSLVELQTDTSGNDTVADARALLARAAVLADPANKQDFWNDKEEKAPPHDAVPFHAVSFKHTIGGRDYVISVLPISPTYIIRAAGKTADAATPGVQSILYLVGLKQENPGAQITDALGPDGTFVTTTIVLLGILLWPFLSLRFAPAHNSIAGFQVFAIIVSLVLLPIVLTTSAIWTWSNLKLQVWADAGAENYASQIERSLLAELDEDASLLAAYGELADTPLQPAIGKTVLPLKAPIRIARMGETTCEAQAQVVQICAAPSVVCNLFLTGQMADTCESRQSLRNWSPLRTNIALKEDGSSQPPRISAFGNVPVKATLNLADREYFKALREEQAWTLDRSSERRVRVVAQRLFNRADAARVLQVAVPRATSGDWTGIVTGDTRAYALTAAVRPPLLRFAVIDRENGEVLFHSNDDRSLTENLLVETQRDSQLLGAMRGRRSNWRPIALDDHFDGNYLGESHRFYYRAVNAVPWGIAVYYSTAALDDVTLDAAIATLATSIAAVTLAVTLMVILAFLWNRRFDRHLLAAIWPQWEWRDHYPRIAVTVTALWVVLLTSILAGLKLGYWSAAIVVILLAAGLSVWAMRKTSWLPLRRYAAGGYRVFYAWCVMAVLCALVVTPTLLLGFGYQDVSMQGYIRGELSQATTDIERRQILMARDLRRWVPEQTSRRDNYPDGRTLADALEVPGYRVSKKDCTRADSCWTLTLFHALPWIDVAGPPEFGYLRNAVWRMTTVSSPQQRRSNRPVQLRTQSGEQDSGARDSGAAEQSNASVRARQRTNDGYVLRVIAAGDVDSGQHRISGDDCRRPAGGALRSDEFLCISEEVMQRDRWWTTQVAILLAVSLLLTLILLVAVTARRLFGIRIPFGARFIESPAGVSFPFDSLLETELRIEQARAEFGDQFTDKDALDMRRIACEPRYRQLWAALSVDERQLLHQLAHRSFREPGERCNDRAVALSPLHPAATVAGDH